MIQIVMKPEKAPVVDREGLYAAFMNGNLLLHVRARNARHAEEKLMFLMERETKGKTLDFNLEQFRQERDDGRKKDDGGLVPPRGREAR